MTQVVTYFLESESVGQQFGCTRMAKRVRPEVRSLDVKCAQSSADDVVDGRGEDGYSGGLYSNEDLCVRRQICIRLPT